MAESGGHEPKVMTTPQVVIRPPKEIHPRLEIRNLLFNHNLKQQRDLFLLALQRLLARPANNATSFFQIGGIHGAPFEPYDRVGLGWDKESKWAGYCWHGSQLFPTWHRPYVMLIEQEMRNCAFEVIAEWIEELGDLPDSDNKHQVQKKIESFQKAAVKLRFPYLDWASMRSLQYGLPDELCGLPEVSVETPFKEMVIGNPLKSFVMPADVGEVRTASPAFNPMNKPKYKVPPDGYPYTPKGYSTVRYPGANYESQAYDLLYNSLQNTAKKFRPGLSYMFGLGTWKEFSNHTTGPRDQGLKMGVSLEGVHDQVHVNIGGGGGHMMYTEVAGFDPIFFLHHANVDRLLALWQAVYDDRDKPATWIQPLEEHGEGTWTSPAVTHTDEQSPLTPFRWREQKWLNDEGKIDQKDLGAFWTSKMVRSLDYQDKEQGIQGLGYTYQELIDWKDLTPGEKLTKINEMYGASIAYNGFRLHVEFTEISKRQLNGPFDIRVFVGYGSDYKVNKDTPTKDNPHFAGSLSIFASSKSASNRCANCKDPARQLLNGSVDLTSAFLEIGKDSLSWSADDLVADEIGGGPPWTHPPKLEDPYRPWDKIQEAVVTNIQWLAIKPDGSEAHHVRMGKPSISWTRPYRLTADEAVSLAEGPSSFVTTPAAALQLPAPVLSSLRILAAPPAEGAAQALASGQSRMPDFLFVHVPPRV